ncbi:MAG: 2-oxoglutarate dehydrogenase complex dihydrolipoyllysine-residue succinyltransferase [Bdellovibrionota bacterium]
MKQHEIKAPSVGESITEVRIGRWAKQEGELVKNGEVILEIESDKATVEVVAEATGVLRISHPVGDTVKVGEKLGTIEEGATATASSAVKTEAPRPAPQVSVAASGAVGGSGGLATVGVSASMSPAVRKAVSETGIDPSKIKGTGKDGRVTKGDVLQFVESGGKAVASSASVPPVQQVTGNAAARERRVPMTLLRQKIAERLVQAQHTAAILTTFNECDMTAVMEVRNKHKDAFKNKHGVALSFMSFFTRAVVEALKVVPAVNARIDGKEVVYHDYYDVGIAVGTERGLVVPVLRDAGSMGFVEIEKGIGALALRAREGKLSIKELSGGTFTISNGGVYGSLLSTPILNPPQSGILGMHKIQERPMAVNGQVLVRPMMFLALSYDHRIIDGKEAVTFLIKVKEGIENPQSLGLDF